MSAAPSSSTPLVLVVNGPNLNLLGEREPHIYGTTTLDEIIDGLRELAEGEGLTIEHFQSNHEGELVDAIQSARGRCAAVIVNAAALTHYAWAIHDALATFDGYVVEVHISNPYARESWRHTSVLTSVADASICGAGPLGYELALRAAVAHLDERDG
jgi:3-dehydroquinate dehydratase-2